MRGSKFFEISILCFLASIVTPIFLGEDFLGYHALVYGWYGIVIKDISISTAWFANCCYIINIILFKFRFRKSQVFLSILTIILSMGGFFIKKSIILINASPDFFAPHIGFIFWIFSFIILFFGQLLRFKKKTED